MYATFEHVKSLAAISISVASHDAQDDPAPPRAARDRFASSVWSVGAATVTRSRLSECSCRVSLCSPSHSGCSCSTPCEHEREHTHSTTRWLSSAARAFRTCHLHFDLHLCWLYYLYEALIASFSRIHWYILFLFFHPSHLTSTFNVHCSSSIRLCDLIYSKVCVTVNCDSFSTFIWLCFSHFLAYTSA